MNLVRKIIGPMRYFGNTTSFHPVNNYLLETANQLILASYLEFTQKKSSQEGSFYLNVASIICGQLNTCERSG